MDLFHQQCTDVGMLESENRRLAQELASEQQRIHQLAQYLHRQLVSEQHITKAHEAAVATHYRHTMLLICFMLLWTLLVYFVFIRDRKARVTAISTDDERDNNDINEGISDHVTSNDNTGHHVEAASTGGQDSPIAEAEATIKPIADVSHDATQTHAVALGKGTTSERKRVIRRAIAWRCALCYTLFTGDNTGRCPNRHDATELAHLWRKVRVFE